MSVLDKINLNNSPSHVAIIMDGNGRWAKKQGHERLYGHNFGVESIRETLKAARELKVSYLTLYAFSTENWNRPKAEVDGLMDLMVHSLANEIKELSEKYKKSNLLSKEVDYLSFENTLNNASRYL
jgi:undecaprenyl diphosphate synthase